MKYLLNQKYLKSLEDFLDGLVFGTVVKEILVVHCTMV